MWQLKKSKKTESLSASPKRELSATDKLLQTVFEYAPIAAIYIDIDGNIKGMNPSFKQTFSKIKRTENKWQYDFIVWLDVPNLIRQDVEKNNQSLIGMKKDNSDIDYEGQNLAKIFERLAQGAVTSTEVTATHIESKEPYRIVFFRMDEAVQNYQTQGVIALFHNISEELTLRNQLITASARQAIGQLAGGIAHDFNNMITATKGSIESLLEHIGPHSPGYADMQMIRQSCHHASHLTRQIMGLSSDIKTALNPLDIIPTMESIQPLLARVFQEDAEIHIYYDAENGNILANEVQIEQIILNLALNAKDAMMNSKLQQENHQFTITIHNVDLTEPRTVRNGILQAGKYLCVDVSDTGGGIPDNVIDSIFEPFFTTKDVGKGTGLGLSMVNSIMQQMGGLVTVRNDKNGAVFSLYFKNIDKQQTAETQNYNDKRTSVSMDKKHILLVDDEAAVRLFTAKILRKYGYDVVEAENGENALKIAKAEMPDLLVTDMRMPVMGGVELIKNIKEIEPNLPILGISGFVRDQEFETIAGLSFIEFIAKPFNMQQLKEITENLLMQAYGDKG